MTTVVFTEYTGGRVFEVDELDPTTLTQKGMGLGAPAGVSRNSAGAVAVAEMGDDHIAVTPSGGPWTHFGGHGSGVGEFIRPSATASLPNGQLLVVDSGNCRLAAIDDTTGAGWTTYGHRGKPTATDPAKGAFADPRGIAVDTSDRIWVTDPGAGRVIRINKLDGSGWTQIKLPPDVNSPIPYGICAHQDGVVIVDVGNTTLVIIDGNGAASRTSLTTGGWLTPTYAASLGTSLVVADIAANEMRIIELDGTGGHTTTGRLRGSPPNLVEPLFDSIGGLGA